MFLNFVLTRKSSIISAIRTPLACGAALMTRRLFAFLALLLLPCFADAWHEQITMAMEKGKFDPNKVAYINLSRARIARSPEPPPAAEAAGSEDRPEAAGRPEAVDRPPVADLVRAAAIAQKPGGHANRLKVLEAFRRWLDDQNRNTGNQN